MSWPKEVRDTIKRLNGIQRLLNDRFVEREQAVKLLVLSTLCQEHLLLVGPPGTAKTEIINHYTGLMDMSAFHYLLTRFTEPTEIFGPLDLASFQAGTYTIRTEGMLPEAQIAFLDEVFQGSSAILNALLTLLNERIFNNGAVRQPVDLLALVGATNFVPDDPSLRAFADRFVLRLEVDKVSDERLDGLLDQGWELEQERMDLALQKISGAEPEPIIRRIDAASVIKLYGRLKEVDMSALRPEYGRLVRELRAEGVELSDRRVVKGLKLVAGAALLREAEKATAADLWPLAYIWNRPEEADVIKALINPRLEEAGAGSLDVRRPVDEILLDLEIIQQREALIASETAWGTHLMEVNKLRRELINNHPQEKEVRAQVEAVIQRGLAQMGAV